MKLTKDLQTDVEDQDFQSEIDKIQNETTQINTEISDKQKILDQLMQVRDSSNKM